MHQLSAVCQKQVFITVFVIMAVWLFAILPVLAQVPDAVILTSPSSSITNNTPTLSWNEATGATWYKLYLKGATKNYKVVQWYEIENNSTGYPDVTCTGGVCSVTITTALTSDAYTWYIRGWNDDGNGEWSSRLTFTVQSNDSLPSKPTLLSPSSTITDPTPVFSWSEVTGATWYKFYLKGATQNKFVQWYEISDNYAAYPEVNCVDGVCSMAAAESLFDDTYDWYIRGWNDNGNGGWSDGMRFTVSTPGYQTRSLQSTITSVQPMTGIVYWTDNENKKSEAISLEFSYMLFNDIVSDEGVYNWQAVENKLNDIASRGNQAIFRFRYVYPGQETSVPDYIKNLSDYNETTGESEGLTTSFPDWTHQELQNFTLEFYTKFAERYDNDSRIAFMQVGFGLWGEYHIYDGPFELGVTFPSKAFQTTFFNHLDAVFSATPWSVSIDASDNDNTPLSENVSVKNIAYGLFDDSFMSEEHSTVNEANWGFFGAQRYQASPAGGEFSYYTDFDQQHVLDTTGNFGTSFETFAQNFHITYMIGNDQSMYQSETRIKAASMATGYKFEIVSFKTSEDMAVIGVKNSGAAPIYYDAYVTVNGVRSVESLKSLQPGNTQTYNVLSGGSNPVVTIECDRLVSGQTIEYDANL